MTQKDWLEVAIRIIGVYNLFSAVTHFAESALMYSDYSRNPDINFRYYIIYGWIYALVGLLLLKAPGILSNYAYPPDSGQNDIQADESSDEANTD